MIAKGQVDIKKVRSRLEKTIGTENYETVSERYAEAYGRTVLATDDVWEEMICDSLGDMNIFSGDEVISSAMSPLLAEVKAAVEGEMKSPTQTRGSPNGKASRDVYWIPKLSQKEWDLLTPKLDQEIETSDNFINKDTKWLYADSKGTKVFAVYGIGDGTEATVLYAVGGAKAESMNDRRKEYEANIYGSERNAYQKNLARLGVEQDRYGNGINRDGQNVSRAVSGVGSVLTGQRRGDNRGAIPSDSEQGKYSGKLETKYSRESGLIDYINQKSGREVDNLSKVGEEKFFYCKGSGCFLKNPTMDLLRWKLTQINRKIIR